MPITALVVQWSMNFENGNCFTISIWCSACFLVLLYKVNVAKYLRNREFTLEERGTASNGNARSFYTLASMLG